jgi:glycosyltransferase involved in cell wall biosynthesis
MHTTANHTEPGPGAARLYTVHEATWWGELDERELRLLDGALTVSALVHPGHLLRIVALRGAAGTAPETTGASTAQVAWTGPSGPVALVTVSGPSGKPDDDAPLDLVVDLGGEQAAFVQPSTLPPARLRQALFAVRGRVPVAFDALRQWRTDRIERRPGRHAIPRTRAVPRADAAPEYRGDRPPAVLFGLHWLELGGAERWALECIAAAEDAGFVPIVLTDRPSSSPWVTRKEMSRAVFVPITSPLEAHQDAALLNGLFDAYDIRGVHVHHSTWLYERLAWIRTRFPWVPIIDSLHILEWRTGGFVDIAVRLSDAIDVHHVISPQLRDYLIQDMRIPREKVVLATLATLTAGAVAPGERQPSERPTVAFVGRLTQQKRPYLFLRLVARLRKDLPHARFVLHGSGELADEVHALTRRLGLTHAVEFRGADHPVAETLHDADVLVITSDNEGVTLTSFEADAHGTLVVSTDVGSQRSVVVDDLLVPRHPLAFLSVARERVVTAVSDRARRDEWLAEQRRKVTAFADLPHAREWTHDLYREWNA